MDKQLISGFCFPLPPSKNNWHRAVNKGPLAGRLLLTQDARKYKTYLAELALINRLRFGSHLPIKMDVLVCPPDRRKRDAHNFVPQLYDAMQEAGVFLDDSQIVDSRVRMGEVVNDGCVFVSMWEITPDRAAWRKEFQAGGQL